MTASKFAICALFLAATVSLFALLIQAPRVETHGLSAEREHTSTSTSTLSLQEAEPPFPASTLEGAEPPSSSGPLVDLHTPHPLLEDLKKELLDELVLTGALYSHRSHALAAVTLQGAYEALLWRFIFPSSTADSVALRHTLLARHAQELAGGPIELSDTDRERVLLFAHCLGRPASQVCLEAYSFST